jgi:hypothetical protein
MHEFAFATVGGFGCLFEVRIRRRKFMSHRSAPMRAGQTLRCNSSVTQPR